MKANHTRKITKQELSDENNNLRNLNVRLECALNAIVNARVEQIHTYSEKEGATYIWTVADLTRGHGGLFMTTFRYKGQSDSFTVQYLDAADRGYRWPTDLGLAERQAIEKAIALRAHQLDISDKEAS